MEVTNNASGTAGAAVGDVLAAMDYPFERLDIEVTTATVAEPSCEGHVEFACTSFGAGGALIEFRVGFGAPTPPPFTEDFSGLKFVQESVAHEIGHVVAGVKVNDPDKIAEMCGLFIRTDPMTGEVSVGNSSRWSAGEWSDRIGEAVAETFKDVFLPKSMRKFDNRTNWDLPQGNFKAYLRLMGLVIEGFDEPKQVQGTYYSPTLTEQMNVGGGETPSENYHADLQSFGVGDRPFWVAKGLSAAGLGAPVPFGDKSLAQGVIGGAAAFTLGDLVFAGPSGVDIELDMTMEPDFTLAYAHDFDPDFPEYNPETWEYVGWAPGLWWQYKTWGYWELSWVVMLRPDEGADFSAHLISAAASYLNSMTHREDLEGLAPRYSGIFPAPTKDGLASVLGIWVDSIISITLNLRVEAWRDDGPESTIRYRGAVPAGPGVVENWAASFWTASWNAKLDPDKLPPWPYVDEPPQASPGPSGRIRRSRARGGLLA